MFVTKKKYRQAQEWADRNQEAYHNTLVSMFEAMGEANNLRAALHEIIEQATAKPNATVTRMIKIAEEALGYGLAKEASNEDAEVSDGTTTSTEVDA